MIKRIDSALIPDTPDLSFERSLWKEGFQAIVGIDEAGRGALAGPVAVGAVIFPPDLSVKDRLIGVKDSKQMTPAKREAMVETISRNSLSYAVGYTTSIEIDSLGIVFATKLAAFRALSSLETKPDFILLDYLLLSEVLTPQASLIKGDCRSLTIAAASILAKTSRDQRMRDFDADYPGYGFGKHKGYGTKEHRLAIESIGPCSIHRMSFKLI
ncbi:MAG: ribonuclease HII [Anaerolineales bacterium]|nr:ribonuclease HII [Anaerolineales bacterium]